jgi:uncharacterized protein YjeT (DUF2065 family)
MPHIILNGSLELGEIAANLDGGPQRWGAAVLKTETSWLRADGLAVLVEGVVIEHSRPLHPVAVVTQSHGDTSVRLWRLAPVERTRAVQRWLALIAGELRRLGTGSVKTTNLADDLWQDLGLD